MKQVIFMALLVGLIFTSDKITSQVKETKTLLAVLAHPDDEAALRQILSRYAREGHKVHLAIAADSRYGVEEHAGIPPGDSLAKIRMEESLCASEILGIEKPFFIGAHDGFGLLHGMGEYFKQTAMIKEKLTELIDKLQPHFIITFGPDGDTGHFDHKGIIDLVTEVILMHEGWYEKYPLFYLAWTKEKEVWIAQGSQTGLNYVNEKYRNIHISYTQEDQNKTFKSLECYKSQFTNEDIEKWIQAEKKDTTFTTYFRQFATNTKVRTEF